MPLISVIVPVYNVEKYLERCIRSILMQTFKDFDLILIDDGSPDNCPELCDFYEKKDKRIFVIHQNNMGLSAARNTGLNWTFKNSDSRWITFIDSDDWVHPRYLESLYVMVKKTEQNISMCLYNCVDKTVLESDLKQIKYDLQNPEFLWDTEYGATVTAWGKLFKKELFKDIRFPVGILSEDLYTLPIILFSQKYIAFTREQLYYYYYNPKGIMNSNWNLDKLTMLKAHKKQIKFFRKNKLYRALKRQRTSYCFALASFILQINQLENKEELKKIIKKLTMHLKVQFFFKLKYSDYIPFTENKWIYDAAFPKMMRCYWLIVALKNKERMFKS